MLSNDDFLRLDRLWSDIVTKIPITDNMNEFLIVKFIVQNQEKFPILDKHPYIYGINYPLDPKFSSDKVNLILTDGEKNFLIIKVMHFESAEKMKRKMEDLLKEASIFAEKFKARYPDYNVDPVVFSNKSFEIEYKELYNEFMSFLDEEWKRVSELYKIQV